LKFFVYNSLVVVVVNKGSRLLMPRPVQGNHYGAVVSGFFVFWD